MRKVLLLEQDLGDALVGPQQQQFECSENSSFLWRIWLFPILVGLLNEGCNHLFAAEEGVNKQRIFL